LFLLNFKSAKPVHLFQGAKTLDSEEPEFDQIFERVGRKHIMFWANHAKGGEGQINHNDGGRGLYFEEPSGHLFEVITRPYGSGK
jgi:hypothetical protein